METWKEKMDLYVTKGGPDECWEWRGVRNQAGYGVAYCAGLKIPAHRVAYMLAKGEIPEGLIIMHKCDNPPCCNPAHVFLGTSRENNEDTINKGRVDVVGRAGAWTRSKRMSDQLTTGQAAALAGVSAQTITNWCEAGRVHAVRVGRGPRRIEKKPFTEYLRSQGITMPDDSK